MTSLEKRLVANYRAENPASRAVSLLRYVVNTSARRQRECILCGWQGPSWCGHWPKTQTAIKAEQEHVQTHLGGS